MSDYFLHGFAIGRVEVIAELVGEFVGQFVGEPFSPLTGFGPSSQMDFEIRVSEQDRRCWIRVLTINRSDQLIHSRLAESRDLECPGADSDSSGHSFELRPDVVVEHGFHLTRRTRQQNYELAVLIQFNPGRRTVWVGQNGAALWN